jgi:hypothetical protein
MWPLRERFRMLKDDETTGGDDMIERITNALRGLGVPAPLVGLARGVVIAAVVAGIQELLVGLTTINIPVEYRWAAPLAALAIRELEAIRDHLDRAKRPPTLGKTSIR